MNVSRMVLRTNTDDLETIIVNALGQYMPDEALDYMKQTINWVLGKTGLIKGYTLPVVVMSQTKLLKKVQQYVSIL